MMKLSGRRAKTRLRLIANPAAELMRINAVLASAATLDEMCDGLAFAEAEMNRLADVCQAQRIACQDRRAQRALADFESAVSPHLAETVAHIERAQIVRNTVGQILAPLIAEARTSE